MLNRIKGLLWELMKGAATQVLLSFILLLLIAVAAYVGIPTKVMEFVPKKVALHLANPQGVPMAQVAVVEVKLVGSKWLPINDLAVTKPDGSAELAVNKPTMTFVLLYGDGERLKVRNADSRVWSEVCRLDKHCGECRLVVDHQVNVTQATAGTKAQTATRQVKKTQAR